MCSSTCQAQAASKLAGSRSASSMKPGRASTPKRSRATRASSSAGSMPVGSNPARCATSRKYPTAEPTSSSRPPAHVVAKQPEPAVRLVPAALRIGVVARVEPAVDLVVGGAVELAHGLGVGLGRPHHAARRAAQARGDRRQLGGLQLGAPAGPADRVGGGAHATILESCGPGGLPGCPQDRDFGQGHALVPDAARMRSLMSRPIHESATRAPSAPAPPAPSSTTCSGCRSR